MRATWTDSRLDDLNVKVDQGFARLDSQIGALDTRMGALEGRMDRLEDRMESIDAKIGSLNQTLLLVGGGIIAAFMTITAGLVGVIVTQL